MPEKQTQGDELLEALVTAWHDVTCPEGAECRSWSLHRASGNTWLLGMMVDHPAVTELFGEWERLASDEVDSKSEVGHRVTSAWQTYAGGLEKRLNDVFAVLRPVMRMLRCTGTSHAQEPDCGDCEVCRIKQELHDMLHEDPFKGHPNRTPREG